MLSSEIFQISLHNFPQMRSKKSTTLPPFSFHRAKATKKPERGQGPCSGRNTNHPRCHPNSKLSFLSRTSYACDITVTPVGAYAAKSLRSALGSPFTKLTCTAITPSAALCSSTQRYYSSSKVIIVTLYSAKSDLSSAIFVFYKFIYKCR